MITDAVFRLLTSVLQYVFSLLPTGNLAGMFAPVTQGAAAIGGVAAQWNSWLPMSETLSALSMLVSTVFPAVIVYKLANWTWRHIPDLWGFGPGAG